MKIRYALAAVLLAASGAASADLAEAMGKCKTIADAQARATCYDAISTAAPDPAPAPAAPPAAAIPAPPPPVAAVPPPPPAAPEAPALPEEIHGKVAGELGGWKLGSVIQLQDGSRWKVTSDDRTGFKSRSNPSVTLKKSFINWWLMLDGTSFKTKVQLVE